MTDNGQSASVYIETIDQLASGDLVHPIRKLDEVTQDLLGEVPRADPSAVAEAPAQVLRPLLDTMLAVAFPLVEHGGLRGGKAVVSAIQTVADRASASETEAYEPIMKLVLHHLLWIVLADAVAHDRVELIPELARVHLESRYGPEQTGVFEVSDLRHATAFDRSADRTYESVRDTLAGLPLREEIARLKREEDFDAALAEAELIAALRFAYGEPDRTYCHIVGQGGHAERRLRLHLSTPEGRSALCTLLETEPKELPARLNELYGSLAGASRFASRSPLVPIPESPRHEGNT